METALVHRLPDKRHGAAAPPARPPLALNGRRVLVAAVMLAASASLMGVATYAGRVIEVPPALPGGQAVPTYLPNVGFMRFASLGFRNVLANVLWFRTISYFGEHYRSDRLYPWLTRMCDVVTDLDPRAEYVYRFAGVILPWEAGLPDEAAAILRKGLRQFPDSWQFHFLLGFNLFFFKNDIEHAVPHVRRATELPGVHSYVSRFAALLYAQQFGPAQTREFLTDVLQNTDDVAMRSVIATRLKELQLGDAVAAIEQGLAAYRDRFGQPPAALDRLVEAGILTALPRDPFGAGFDYDARGGTVASRSGRKPLRLYSSAIRTQVLNGEIPRE